MADTFEFINLKNKKLNGRPIVEWMLYYEPNERLMLWIIYNCKEAFNPKHSLQYSKSKDPNDPNEHALKESFKLLQNLKGRGFVSQDKDGNYKLTIKGHLFRLTSHPQWILIQLLIAAVLAFVVAYSIVLINRNSQSSQVESESRNGKSMLTTSDSAQYKSAEIQSVKDSASFLTDSGKAKIKLLDTLESKQQIIKPTKRQ